VQVWARDGVCAGQVCANCAGKARRATLQDGRAVLAHMDAAGVAADAISCNTLLSLCARVGSRPAPAVH
jgi:hypothetical protein